MSDLFALPMNGSPIPQAMDVYFEQLNALIRTPASQKIALVSNLASFPISSGSRLYNKYVGRCFADRAIEVGSPESVDSLFLGPASTSDRFSAQYGELLRRCCAAVDVELSQEARNQLELSRRRLREQEEQLDRLYQQIGESWRQYRRENWPDRPEAELILQRAGWYRTHRFGRRVASIVAEMDRELIQQEQIVGSLGNEEASLAYRLLNDFQNSRVYLPRTKELEITHRLDEISMADESITTGSEGWADVAPDTEAIADYDLLLQSGASRGFTLSREDSVSHQHERQWSVSATARYGFFFTASASASDHVRMSDALRDTLSISFNFQHTAQLWIRRGDWYNAALFGSRKARQVLSRNRMLASRLKYVVSSIVVGRGLSVSVAFGRESSSSYLHEYARQGSASILGIFPIGRGSVSGSTQTQSHNVASKTVTFQDDANICRLLAFTVEPLHDLGTDQDSREIHGIFPTESDVVRYLNQSYTLGADEAAPSLLTLKG
jgi:hypothetical protein